MLAEKKYSLELANFIASSPTAFHAVASAVELLKKNGFQQLDEKEVWQKLPPGKYFVLRNDSSLIGFIWQEGATSLEMIGAHTDSPCLKVKPKPVIKSWNCFQLGVEIYGGALLRPWLDRELSLAGRALWHEAGSTELHSSLIDFKRPIAIIPNLAIHLNHEANKMQEVNRQTDMVPLLSLTEEEEPDFLKIIEKQLRNQFSQDSLPAQICITDHELFFYDVAPPVLIGLEDQFLTGARLDNQVSCFAALQALLSADAAETTQNCMIILNDHEEVGSTSASGAQGSFLSDMLERLLPNPEERQVMLRKSLFISADNAHALHPNFADKHDPQHQPLMNKGPVIKINANQRYATNAGTAARFRLLCQQAEVPVQEFVVRNDMGCGSTIGPLTAAKIGVDTVDVGVPSLAMHSIRETAACKDCWYLYQVLQTFFSAKQGHPSFAS
ncbi:MAG: M18 family aminopeptidase [Candidatus Electrothrix communis]|nr:M18 family aminopeptidase [Desulfobulbus sp. US4]WLE97806.1 MAG: M18 family aminopeptidase [Candidatus Electrothrix communis]